MIKKIILSGLVASLCLSTASANEPSSSASWYFNEASYSTQAVVEPTINDIVKKIALELKSNAKTKDNTLNETVTITSFVNLHDLTETSHFGRILSESLYSELNSAGFEVSDSRGQKALSINKDGEFYLSRDVSKLKKEAITRYVLVGTYSRISEGVIINTRIIDNTNGKIYATSRVVLKTNDCKLFDSCKAPEPKVVEKIVEVEKIVDKIVEVEPKRKKVTISIVEEK